MHDVGVGNDSGRAEIASMATFYITFGQSHPLRNGWVEIAASDRDRARHAAFDRFGQKWAMLYDETNFNPSYFPAGKYGETLVDTES